MSQSPIGKMCRAPPCFASTDYHDSSLEIQARRDKYRSAKSRCYKTMKTRTKCPGSLTSQHWTDSAQNAAHPALHFYLVQPLAVTPQRDGVWNRVFLKHCRKGKNETTDTYTPKFTSQAAFSVHGPICLLMLNIWQLSLFLVDSSPFTIHHDSPPVWFPGVFLPETDLSAAGRVW